MVSDPCIVTCHVVRTWGLRSKWQFSCTWLVSFDHSYALIGQDKIIDLDLATSQVSEWCVYVISRSCPVSFGVTRVIIWQKRISQCSPGCKSLSLLLGDFSILLKDMCKSWEVSGNLIDWGWAQNSLWGMYECYAMSYVLCYK